MSPILAVAEQPREQTELSFISTDKPHALVMAAQTLVAHLAKGRTVDAPALRSAMESAFGASDAQGAWSWKDAYEAVEAAQVLFLRRFAPAMFSRAENDPARVLAMLSKVGALLPSETRRSEECHALQQFSTPLEFAYVASLAARISADDVVLEPSAGTGMLAIFAELSGAKLVLNEWAETRGRLLERLFPSAALSRVDGAHINDRLDASIVPSVVLMNPPFSASPLIEGRHAAATFQHVRSALASSRRRPPRRHHRREFRADGERLARELRAPAGAWQACFHRDARTRLFCAPRDERRKPANDFRQDAGRKSKNLSYGLWSRWIARRAARARAAGASVAQGVQCVAGARNGTGAATGFALNHSSVVNRAPGKPIPQMVYDKLKAAGVIVDELGPDTFLAELRKVWREDMPHVAVATLLDWFASYVYLSRLRDDATLALSIEKLISKLESPVAFARSFNEADGTYVGVAIAKEILFELTRPSSSSLKITLEIEGTAGLGYPQDVVDVVRANLRDLKLDISEVGFEEE